MTSVLMLTTPASARPRGTVVVAVHDGAITLEANAAAWPDVLRELTRTTGMVVHVAPLPEQPVTASFTRVDAARALRRLFGDAAGFAFVYGAGPVPAEVWVASVTPVRAAAAVSYSDVSAPAVLAAVSTPGLGAADAEIRANEALRLAGEEGDGAVDALARVILSDPDAGVRSAAARGLVQIGTPRAIDAARHAVFDEARLVRLHTVEALADKGGEPALRVLREALRDQEQTVRDAAAAGIPDAR